MLSRAQCERKYLLLSNFNAKLLLQTYTKNHHPYYPSMKCYGSFKRNNVEMKIEFRDVKGKTKKQIRHRYPSKSIIKMQE